jgi:hypothetical protein
MDRVVYFASNQMLEEAITHATKWGIAIQIGDSERTKHLEFDRSIISVISVPCLKGFAIDLPFVIDYGHSIAFEYHNDFTDIKKFNLTVTRETSPIQSTFMIRDLHCAVCSFVPDVKGVYVFTVMDGESVVDSFEATI